MTAALECRDLHKVYGEGDLAQTVLGGVSLRLGHGECAALIGPSGSGKTTLLSILGCLLAPSEGSVAVASIDAYPVAEVSLGELRRRHLGFVFQHAQLLPFLSALDNLTAIGLNAGMSRDAVADRSHRLLERLGIGSHAGKRPGELSGGQRQRVAIARALLHRPAVVLADEPTAALDWENGEAAIDLLIEEARAENAALLVVTHDTRLVQKFDRVFAIDNGKLKVEHS